MLEMGCAPFANSRTETNLYVLLLGKEDALMKCTLILLLGPELQRVLLTQMARFCEYF